MNDKRREEVMRRILDGLRGCREDNPTWLAVQELLEYQIELANAETLGRDLSDSARANRAGTEWGLKAFQSTLRIMHSKAQQAPPPDR